MDLKRSFKASGRLREVVVEASLTVFVIALHAIFVCKLLQLFNRDIICVTFFACVHKNDIIACALRACMHNNYIITCALLCTIYHYYTHIQ